MRNDIENKILIPFMILLILSILVLTTISITNNYKLLLYNEIDDSKREIKNILTFIDNISDKISDEEEARSFVLEYLADSERDNFYVIHNENFLINNGSLDNNFFDSQDYLLTQVEYEKYDWKLGYALVKSSFFYEVLNYEKYLILGAIIIMIISMQVTIIVSYNISRPIKQLATYCDKIIDSSSFNEQINIKRNDEIGRLSEALNNMILRVEENNERLIEMKTLSTIGQFAAGIAHEVRNPLTGMKTSIQVLKSRLFKEDNSINERLFDGVISEIERLNELVTDLLHFSRPKAPVFQEAKLVSIIDKTLEGINKIADDKSIKIDFKYQEDIIVWADKYNLEQVFLNLFNNAINSIKSKGVINIIINRLEKDSGDLVQIQVQDNGCGIDEENLKKIFNPFFTTRSKGTGLGLSIVHELIKLNKGKIKINSKLNEGTIVIIEFPIYGVEDNEEKSFNY